MIRAQEVLARAAARRVRAAAANPAGGDEGRAILADANHPLVTLAAGMDEGADKAAELANA